MIKYFRLILLHKFCSDLYCVGKEEINVPKHFEVLFKSRKPSFFSSLKKSEALLENLFEKFFPVSFSIKGDIGVAPPFMNLYRQCTFIVLEVIIIFSNLFAPLHNGPNPAKKFAFFFFRKFFEKLLVLFYHYTYLIYHAEMFGLN